MKKGEWRSFFRHDSVLQKILLPHALTLTIVLCTLLYLAMISQVVERRLIASFRRVEQANFLINRISSLSNEKKRMILAYRFTRNPLYPIEVARADKEIASLILGIPQFTVTNEGAEALQDFSLSRSGVEAVQQELFTVMNSRDEGKVQRTFNRWTLKVQRMEAALLDLSVYKLKRLARARHELEVLSRRFEIVIFIMMLTLLTTIIISALYARRRIIRPLKNIINFAKKVGHGELDTRLMVTSTGDEISVLGDTLNHMTLQESIDSLSRSNESLEHFASMASHDIKEPLRTVSNLLGLIELKAGKTFDPETRGLFRITQNAAMRMSRMVDALLEYSRIGREGPPKTSVNFNEVVETVKQNLSLAIKETQAEVVSKALPTLKAREGEMVHLFQNLIGNALKYKSSLPPKVEISAKKAAGPAFLFSVCDNGIGIEKAKQRKVFAMFYRGNDGPRGSGIGLSICKKIIEKEGGSIWVESEPGKGSSFFFTLPET